MIRKIGLFLCLSTNLLSQNVFAAPMHVFQAGPAAEYILPVEEPQIIANVFLWTVKATCKVTSENESNLLAFEVRRKSGSLNGTKLSVGDTMSLLVYNNDKFIITAAPGAQVELVNHGEQKVRALCSSS